MRDGIQNWSDNPDLNTDVSGINIAEGCPPGNINDALRQIMASMKSLYANSLVNSTFFKGMIIPYYGDLSLIDTTAWAVCDGTRGTPDLRGRCIFGTGAGLSYGTAGGNIGHSHTLVTSSVSATIYPVCPAIHANTAQNIPFTLTQNEMPTHTHKLPNGIISGARRDGTYGVTSGTTYHALVDGTVVEYIGGGQPHNHGQYQHSHSQDWHQHEQAPHSHTSTTSYTQHYPLHYVLHYIMKL